MRATLRCAYLALLSLVLIPTSATAQQLPLVIDVEAQPLKAQVKRIAQALDFLGEPLTKKEKDALKKANAEMDKAKALRAIQEVLDARVLVGVNINPESRVKVARGPAKAELVEQGWTVFLVKVANEAGVTAPLRAHSPNAAPLVKRSSGAKDPPQVIKPQDVSDRWMDIQTFDQQPLTRGLSGLRLEYRILQVYSRDKGKREGKLLFDVGQGTQDLGFRNEAAILFDCDPAVKLTLDIVDHNGKPTTGQFVIRDQMGRVYPARSRRLAPDFFFHNQIYRHNGEHVSLPPGKYNVVYTRGPEYRILNREIEIPHAETARETFRLQRWIKLADHRWFSGDHHVHAAGCSHYESPSQGVTPEAMMRHILGEDLNVGCVLSWGPCWYYQKEFFEGDIHKLSTKNYLMRYDVEVSGFPSSHAGHLCLLRLKEDDYPGTERVEQWPSWDLPVLKWGKEQGGVVGFSHSGWGLNVPGDELPNYNIPPYNGIGANEYIVDVVHDVCDFISAVDTPSIWELSIWYHTLNCGYTCRISGETDFPCIYGERVGLGRVYVKLDKDQELTYDNWIFGIRDGRSYCSDGLTHLFDFEVNGLGVGEKGKDERPSFVAAQAGDKIDVSVRASALLGEKPNETIRNSPLDRKPYWHVERARVKNSRKVPVELIVNGVSVETQEIEADGSIHDLKFNHKLERSSWVALRIFPAAHTNPVFIEVDGKPIRASRRSAEWCRKGVDVCWDQKSKRIRAAEIPAAKAAFDTARKAYDAIIAESYDDREK
ncbi:MAG: CehA/McbA family metallohydrolase [Pirellulaceae bacterium]|jgi:hypothetical protein|nr:CehA/McbA family metallohydrolase [Pirellulaceae bacterium]MDP7019494.1 CehA/McbA family metallohydrolase [Pirellulaceae bacterium]